MNQRLLPLVKNLPNVASVAIGIVPLVIMVIWFGVSRKIIAKGAIAYAAGAVGLKLPLYHLLVVKLLHKKLSDKWLAVSQGLLSAFSELGAALGIFIFVVPELTLAELIGFGMASGSIEAIILPFMKNPLEGTPLESHVEETMQKSSNDLSVQWLGVVERIIATFIHIAARGLVYISYATGNVIPAILAIFGFASIDGRAYYAHLQKWRFDDSRVLCKFYRYMGMIVCVLILFFISLYFYLM